MAPGNRALATVLFTDIVGSTERAEALGDAAWRDLLDRHHALVRRELRRLGGREVSTAGDGFLAVFDRPDEAIRCAWAVREAVLNLGVELRCGIHMGEVEQHGRDVGGIAVHIGARVAGHAEPGEILVSGTVRDAESGSGFGFEDLGAHGLKGIAGEWRLYRVAAIPKAGRVVPRRRRRWTASLPAGAAILVAAGAFVLLFAVAGLYFGFRVPPHREGEATGMAPAGAEPGLAVLPFSVRGEGLEVWREGVVDLVSANLDGVGSLRAIDSRTVLARWRESVLGDQPPDLVTSLNVARDAGARYALVGSAVAIGPRVRLTGDLYDVETQRSLGDVQVEGAPDSVYSLVDRLSIQIAGRMATDRDGGGLDLAAVTTSSLPALKAFLAGEAALRRSDFKHAVAAYQTAVDADSTFALAWYRMAFASSWTGADAGIFTDQMQRAVQLADRLTPRKALLAEAVSHWGTGNELPLLRRAVELYPDDPDAWYFLGDAVYHLGEQLLLSSREAEIAFSRAVALDPAFTPAYLHLMERLSQRGDTVRVRQLLSAFEQSTEETEFVQGFRLSYALAFGDSVQRARAQAAVPDAPSAVLFIMFATLPQHPRWYDSLDLVLRTLHERPEEAEATLWPRGILLLFRGRVREAAQLMDDPLTPEFLPAIILHTGQHMRLRVPQDALERALQLGAADTLLDLRTFHAGLYEAERGRWFEHERLVQWSRRRAHELAAEGDSTSAFGARSMAAVLEGYGAWKRGDARGGLKLLQEAQRRYVGLDTLVNGINWHVRWFLGDLLMELNRPNDARPYFESLQYVPLAQYHLGQIYEQLDQLTKSRDAYAFFLEGWKHADPELQPMSVEAHAAVQRLTGLIKE